MRRAYSCIASGLLLPALGVAILIWMEATAFGEPPNTFPAGLGSGHMVIAVDGLVQRDVDMRQLALVPLRFPLKAPLVSQRGDVTQWGTAVVENGRSIRAHFRNHQERVYQGPGPRVFDLVWSPDGRFLAYTYEFGIDGIGSSQSESHAIGILDLGSGTNYRLHASPIERVTADQRGSIHWLPN